MCRLTLMNRQAVTLMGTDLAQLFTSLEASMGGHGNGIAALWSLTKEVKIHKGLKLSSTLAAEKVHMYVQEGADWILFHTRLATSASKTSANCHPFKSGQLVLAHNGHSWTWDQLGASVGISDSECIAQVWSRLHLPISALKEAEGVFIGFQAGRPFVVKGRYMDDLTVAAHEETGAILFASELEEQIERRFDQTIEAGTFFWPGGVLNLQKIEQRQDNVSYHSYPNRGGLPHFGNLTPPITTAPPSDKKSKRKNAGAEISLADLRKYYQSQEQELPLNGALPGVASEE